MIELIHLDKTYPAADGDVVALEDINLTIEDGAIYGIIGHGGAGARGRRGPHQSQNQEAV